MYFFSIWHILNMLNIGFTCSSVSEPWPIHYSGSGSGETCHIFTEIFIWIFYENTRMIVFMILFLSYIFY